MSLTKAIQHLGDAFPYPISLANIDLPDQPLIYINRSFCELTQYQETEILGRNCRFLQGPLTDRNAVARIRQAISESKPLCQDLLNYTRQNHIFYNRVVLVPFQEETKHYFLGLQHQIPEEQFRQIVNAASTELLDKTLNPLASILSAFQLTTSTQQEKQIAEAVLRIRSFVLSF